MVVFEKELEKHERNRQELANAEKLFDLPITMYPDLIKIQKEMKGLRQIYEIYKLQQVDGFRKSVKFLSRVMDPQTSGHQPDFEFCVLPADTLTMVVYCSGLSLCCSFR